MPEKEGDILTLSETAEYLKISEKTLQRMIAKGEIPCAKIGNQWRFLKNVIDEWLMSKMRVLPQNDLSKLLHAEEEFFSLSRMLKRDHVIFDLSPAPKREILEQLARPLIESQSISDGPLFLEKLIRREDMASTALSHGIAIPHVRKPQENPNGGPDIVIGISPKGLDFQAVDESPTHLFFLIYTDSEILHLRLMRKIAVLFRDEAFISEIISSQNYDELISKLMAQEQRVHFKPQG